MYMIRIASPYQIYHLQIFFSHSVGFLFILLVSFAVQKFLTLIRSHFYVCFCFLSSHTFRSLMHFKFIFVHSMRQFYNFIIIYVALWFSHHHISKRLSFFQCIFFPPLNEFNFFLMPNFYGKNFQDYVKLK